MAWDYANTKLGQVGAPLTRSNPAPQPMAPAPVTGPPASTIPGAPSSPSPLPPTAGLPSGDAYAYLTAVLSSYGLSSLSSWAWDQIINGAGNEEILQRLRDTTEFKTRFKAIVQREQAGLPPMSPAEVVAYENQAAQLMRAAGLPPGFYDSPDDFADLMGAKNVSMAELSDRINQGYARVANTDPYVRQAFADLFGPSGDAALASVFLDADKALPALEQQASAAEFAGTGLQFGFVVGKDLALSAANANLPSYRVRTDWQAVADMKPLFSSTVGEGGQPAITPDKGVEAVFGIGQNPTGAREQVARRQGQRAADFGGGGGADVGSGGVKGLGKAPK